MTYAAGNVRPESSFGMQQQLGSSNCDDDTDRQTDRQADGLADKQEVTGR